MPKSKQNPVFAMMEEREDSETKRLHQDAGGSHVRRINPKNGILEMMLRPIRWLRMLSEELHWSFVLGVVIVYGISQGFGVGLSRVSTQYYMKDEQKSLCGMSSSIGALLGFSLSGFFVHLVGAKGVFGLLAIPASLVVLVGILLRESQVRNFAYRKVKEKIVDASKAMWTTLKCRDVWRPCLYMYLSLALGLHIHEGMFYWYTDAKEGPSFSQEVVGSIFSVGAVGSLFGVLLYQNFLKNHPFRDILFWAQLLHGVSGLLDLVLVLRINLKLGMPDYFFVVVDEAVSRMIGRIKWMPFLVLSSKLCPSGIEGTFFALIMSIDHIGLLSSAWSGGLVLHMLNVTRTQFDNLWIAIVIRSLLRLIPIGFLFLIPRSDPNLSILPSEMLRTKRGNDVLEPGNIEMATLVNSI
ncbi:hypothetical protein J1N35_031591 [Gossypium stocksii]|uniref:Folate-biopterin transporter 3 n=1 Tax=Gossypium stocksii TaxID=47602 RepID=A0A9D3V4J9_9ROSI|nr:hypothetical protein J1N35_031591 [Gossypium stocksii]